MISVVGFNKSDTVALKSMIQAIGARFLPFTPETNFLVVNKK
jgi:hypothetical protein